MLAPIILTEEQLAEWEELEQENIDMPSKTYKIDFETGDILPVHIDNEDAVLQALMKVLKTHRYNYAIYSEDYGSEFDTLLGEQHTLDYLNIEIPRLIEEAVELDDRIILVDDFNIQLNNNIALVSFSVQTNITSEILNMEVELYV